MNLTKARVFANHQFEVEAFVSVVDICPFYQRFRSIPVIVLAVFAQCFFGVENVQAHEGWGIVVDRQG